MVTNPVIGNRYWCLEEAIEGHSYGSVIIQNTKPWIGILSQNSRGYLRLHRFNKETEEIDEDTNATAIVKPCDLYENYDEVLSVYIEQERSDINSLKQLILDREQSLLFFEKQQKADPNWKANLDEDVIAPEDEAYPEIFSF